MLFSLLAAQTGFAQTTVSELDNGRKIFIVGDYDEPATVQVGDTLSDVFVSQRLEESELNGDTNFRPNGTTSFSTTSYSLWSVEPASAARVIQSMPIRPANSAVDIEFLEATTVTVTVLGFDQEDTQNASETDGMNQVVYTFNVQERSTGETGSDTDNEQALTESTTPPALTRNQQATQTAFIRACAALPAGPSEGDSNGEFSLRSTCSEFALQNDMAASLDRLSAEELFAMGDALVSTADNQISNVESRIQTVRRGNREVIDISALNVQLWDETISGSVLGQAKSALTRFAGGGASADALKDNPIGFFSNGNIVIGSVDGNGIQRDADISTNSLSVGADYRVDDNLVLGTALGIVNDKTDFNGDNGDLSMSGFSLSAFGTWYEQDKGYADIIVDISKNDFDLDRRINLPTQQTEFASGATSATRFTFSMNAGRTFQRGATEFGPMTQITLMKGSIDGFSETSSLDNDISSTGTTLDVDKQSITSVRFSLGGEVRHVINTSKAVFVPSISFKFQKENETDKDAITARFENDTENNQLEFTGTQRDRSVLLLSVGTTAAFRHSQSAFVFYDLRTQDNFASSNRLRVGYRVHF